MRLVQHSPQHITIHSPNWLLLIMAVSFLGSALLILLVFGSMVILNCDRSQPPAGTCVLETTAFFVKKQVTLSVQDLRNAYVDVSYGDSDSSDTYRVVLVTSQGEIPFTRYYSGGSKGKDELVVEINKFIQNKAQNTLAVKMDDRFWLSIIAGVFGGAGALMGLLAGTTTIDLDRSTGLMTTRKRSLISNSTTEQLISDLQETDVESSSSTHRVVLRMRDGSVIPLTSYYSSGYESKRKLADEVKAFIGGAQFPTVS